MAGHTWATHFHCENGTGEENSDPQLEMDLLYWPGQGCCTAAL